MSYPSSGQPWPPGQPGQPDPDQTQYGGYPGGSTFDPGASGPYGPAQPPPGYPQHDSFNTQPPYSGQPYSGQPYQGPAYGQQPHPGGPGNAPPPQHGGYQQPYQPPLQAGFQQVPRASRSSGGLIALIIGAAALLLIACGVGGVLVFRSASSGAASDDYPATIVLPDTVAGMPRVTSADLQKSADATAAKLKTDTDADSAVAGYYAPTGDLTRTVGLIAVTARINNPEKELDSAFDSSLKVTGVREVDPGPMGGVMKCGTTGADGTGLTACGWADGGSIAMGFFANRSVGDSSVMFVQIRSEILRRG